METLKIVISEVEGMTFKIDTVFTAHSFNKFYKQLLSIAKSMPNIQLLHSPNYQGGRAKQSTPERFTMRHWLDDEENRKILEIWENQGREATIKWFNEEKEFALTENEIAKLSGLMGAFRNRYRMVGK